MSLREELARRLARICETEEDWGLYTTQADECIRQMEWARTRHGEKWEGDGRDGTRHIVDLDEEPLTLAPEDWKP